MSVYGMVVLSIALAAVGILLEANVDVFYAVVGLMIMLGNTSLLCLIFIPKVCVYVCVYTRVCMFVAGYGFVSFINKQSGE